MFFSASDDFISLTFSLLKITLLIIRVWATDGAQTAKQATILPAYLFLKPAGGR